MLLRNCFSKNQQLIKQEEPLRGTCTWTSELLKRNEKIMWLFWIISTLRLFRNKKPVQIIHRHCYSFKMDFPLWIAWSLFYIEWQHLREGGGEERWRKHSYKHSSVYIIVSSVLLEGFCSINLPLIFLKLFSHSYFSCCSKKCFIFEGNKSNFVFTQWVYLFSLTAET